ncbi:hypothetical protein HPP92_019323 [Vanilla planifolia]|uniref:Uncharacterized protein n=1 Tax=Vanilla planifolia TaxID=51239 RepID=A0A835UJ77_VANPL|nr:hypothetical protein HPP92_019323 [Vanilla planifolia]
MTCLGQSNYIQPVPFPVRSGIPKRSDFQNPSPIVGSFRTFQLEVFQSEEQINHLAWCSRFDDAESSSLILARIVIPSSTNPEWLQPNSNPRR